jgi:hypothetical protein
MLKRTRARRLLGTNFYIFSRSSGWSVGNNSKVISISIVPRVDAIASTTGVVEILPVVTIAVSSEVPDSGMVLTTVSTSFRPDDVETLQPHVKQSSKSHSKRGARKGQNTKTTILYMPDLTTNY